MELLFEKALSELDSPIAQRRSGKVKANGFSTVSKAVPAARLFLEFTTGGPKEILESGRVLARTLASGVDAGARLSLARAFCGAIITTYWFSSQQEYPQAWPLPNHFLRGPAGELDGPTASLARVMGEAAARLDSITASYLIGVTYTSMLPEETRSRLGVYYTPPGLARRLIEMATHAGVDWSCCRIIDPACGGGAFLAPVAARIVAGNQGLPARELLRSIAARVRGFEIDPFAAWASQVFLEATLMPVCRRANERLPVVVEICNSLLRDVEDSSYDLVIGNPPYGRVTLKPEVRERYQRSLYGHANLYGMFTDLAIRLARYKGVIAYVTPTSFLAGEYFKALRTLLAAEAPPVNLDFVSVRKGVFEDVLQETLLATYLKGVRVSAATVHFISPADEQKIKVEPTGTFVPPRRSGSPWLIPRTPDQGDLIAVLQKMPHRLSDYGYEVSTGPLVWNRHKGQLANRPGKGALPLIWAESVTAEGRFVFRADKKNHEPYFMPRDGDEWLISRKPCVLLQRTTAKEQNRRLIAAELPRRFLAEHGAVVIENHLNMVRAINGIPAVPLKALCAFLNSEIVDRAFRCISGSVAVSAFEIEALPLPPPEQLAPLEKLLDARIGREMIESFCTALFRQKAPE